VSKRPILLAVNQQLREGAALGIAPELADPVGPLKVRQHQDVEQFDSGAGPRAKFVCVGVVGGPDHSSEPGSVVWRARYAAASARRATSSFDSIDDT
jgi:hypothetical protein